MENIGDLLKTFNSYECIMTGQTEWPFRTDDYMDGPSELPNMVFNVQKTNVQ